MRALAAIVSAINNNAALQSIGRFEVIGFSFWGEDSNLLSRRSMTARGSLETSKFGLPEISAVRPERRSERLPADCVHRATLCRLHWGRTVSRSRVRHRGAPSLLWPPRASRAAP